MSIDRSKDLADAKPFPKIRVVDSGAPLRWLAAGWSDFRHSLLASGFYGLCFAVGGWLLYYVFSEAYALFAGLTTGFLLLGPFLAMGLYDLSRQREQGKALRLVPSLSAWRPNFSNIGLFAGVLAIVLLIWARASVVIFAVFFEGGLPTFGGVVRAIFAFEQPEFALVYFVIGGFFAGFVFCISVVAVPLMLDRQLDAITSAIASAIACMRNPGTMLLWGACVTLLVGFGFATLFLGLIVAMPVVGHATWHAYRELIEVEPAAGAAVRESPPTEKRAGR